MNRRSLMFELTPRRIAYLCCHPNRTGLFSRAELRILPYEIVFNGIRHKLVVRAQVGPHAFRCTVGKPVVAP